MRRLRLHVYCYGRHDVLQALLSQSYSHQESRQQCSRNKHCTGPQGAAKAQSCSPKKGQTSLRGCCMLLVTPACDDLDFCVLLSHDLRC